MEQHAETTGAWLVLGGFQEPPSTMLFPASQRPPKDARELTPAECVHLSAVLMSWKPCEGMPFLEAISAAVRSRGCAEGAVFEWVAAQAEDVHGGQQDPCLLLEKLGRDLRVAALPAARSIEAELLVRTVQHVQEHLALLGNFEKRLAEARLEAVRELAYGAGHEINNPLANIATRGQSLLRDETEPERRRKLATIVDQAFRARDMIGGLMVFAKPPAPSITRVDLGGLAESVLGTLADLPLAAGVDVVGDVPPHPVWARIDPQLVAEAMHAVLVNALEAVAADGRVGLTVVSNYRGGFHAVVVEDDGPGIDADEREAAFDPFHCGREAGRGLGVGLSKAWALARACGGTVVLSSRGERGASVRIELPADRAERAARTPAAPLVQ